MRACGGGVYGGEDAVAMRAWRMCDEPGCCYNRGQVERFTFSVRCLRLCDKVACLARGQQHTERQVHGTGIWGRAVLLGLALCFQAAGQVVHAGDGARVVSAEHARAVRQRLAEHGLRFGALALGV